MKIILFLVFIQMFSFGQDLTDEQRMIFDRMCLTVSPIQVSKWGMSWGRTVSDWYATQGFRKIEKYEFLQLVGYLEEADIVERVQDKQEGARSGSTILGLSGLGLFSLAILRNSYNDPTEFIMLWGGGTLFLATSLILYFLEIDSPVVVPYEKAKQIAETYNEKLKRDIAEGKIRGMP